MDINKLTAGDRVIVVSGIVLFIFSFFSWFTAEIEDIELDSGNAWDFTLPLIAVLIGIAMVVLVVLKLAGVELGNPGSTTWGLILLIAGVVCFALVLIKFIAGVDVPEVLGEEVDIERKIGIFVGLVASAGLAIGGWLSYQQERGAIGGPSPSAPPTA